MLLLLRLPTAAAAPCEPEGLGQKTSRTSGGAAQLLLVLLLVLVLVLMVLLLLLLLRSLQGKMATGA